MPKCIVNVGLYRSGTTTLANAASRLGLKSYRDFPELTQFEHKKLLQYPDSAMQDWSKSGGIENLVELVCNHDIICDGWVAVLPFLPLEIFDEVERQASKANVELTFVATFRDVDATVKSELQHWVVHDLERQAGLNSDERNRLEDSLRERALQHQRCVKNLSSLGRVTVLPLTDVGDWPVSLSTVSGFAPSLWSNALKEVGTCYSNPPLPVEGILLTMRLEDGETAEKKLEAAERLLNRIGEDHLCQYLVVIGIDADERDTDVASSFVQHLQSRADSMKQMRSFHVVTNPSGSTFREAFAICRAWNAMAVEAWKHGADWVVLLGDDVEIDCSYHYRAFYRSFLDTCQRLGVPFGFGCPFWNDTSFPGFPSFPCVGKAHFEIFGSLVPEHRKSVFVNQDLDPYLHNLYLKLDASPCVTKAKLCNGVGGNSCNISSCDARYERVPAKGWRDFVVDDFREYVRPRVPKGTPEDILVDVVVPSFRVRLDYLQSICDLVVPERLHTNFIIIVDNKEALLRAAREIRARLPNNGDGGEISVPRAVTMLEDHLARTGNTVRVRCNEKNLGASASRNRGIDESCAEFVLNLDDDLIPNRDLLERYGSKLLEMDENVVGLVGLVRFPRTTNMPLRHAAVLMSYLTFMFEIAERDLYANPAWGVTANILFRRTHIRFDLAYAKTGGGEDVDYALRVTEACGGGRLLAVPEARVTHPFWPGSALTLSSHFYSWAIGDGALFKRFPEHRYWSFPNLSETLLIALVPFCLWIGAWEYLQLVVCSLAADCFIDLVCGDWNHRIGVVHGIGEGRTANHRGFSFYLLAHILANLYVFALECGRLRGHIGRLDMVYGVFRRFDWHIGRLPNSRRNFRTREAQKFGMFVAVVVRFVIANADGNP